MKSLARSAAVTAILVVLVASSALAADWEVWVVTLKGTVIDYTGQRSKYVEYDTLLINYDTTPLSITMLDEEDNVMWQGTADAGERHMNYVGMSAADENVVVGYARFDKKFSKFSGKQYEWYWDGVSGWHLQMNSKAFFDGVITLSEDLSDLKPALAALKAARPAAQAVDEAAAVLVKRKD